jgi:hypothetical protein
MNKLSVLISKDFWDDALLRGVRTFFQAALAFIGVNIISVTEIDYVGAASIGAGAALISVAQSIVRTASQNIESVDEEEAELVEEINDSKE